MRYNLLTFFAFTRYWENQIQFSPDLIPLVNASLPVFEKGDAVLPPFDFVFEIANNVDPNAVFKRLDNRTLAGYANNTLIAFVDSTTNTSKVFPLLEPLRPGDAAELGRVARAIANQLAPNQTLFPTLTSEKLVPLAPMTLSRSKSFGSGNNTIPEDTLAYVRLQRQFNGYPVVGPETQAMIAVSADNNIHALAHRWRKAISSNKTINPFCRSQITRAILDQLYPLAKRGCHVKVNNVTVAYYDGGSEYFQPVYLFEVTILSTSGYPPRSLNANLFGYVSIGESVEPLPELEIQKGPSPADPIHGLKTPKDEALKSRDDIITVARYVVRNDDPDWTNSANAFWENLNQGGAVSGLSFNNSEYAFAYPLEFVSDQNAYIDSVQIALTEAHGNWGYFTTYQTDADYVFLTDIAANGGYGSNANGTLAYWIIHSCEVIPGQIDEADYLDVWHGIFQGMHSVVGYRTEMFINDGVTTDFGYSVGIGAPVVASWHQAVASASLYQSALTYNDSNTNTEEPYGCASSVSVCDHMDDTATDLDGIADSTCLQGYSIGN
jgi:Family of unknown function (DUF6345)